MKQPINVKKFGNTCTIYITDFDSDSATSISSFDDEPEGAFPQTLSIHRLVERYGNRYDINFLEKPAVELPTSNRVRIDDAALSALKSTGHLPKEQTTAPVQSGDAAVLRALELMIVKLSVAEGKKLKALQAEYAAVKKFIVRLYPEMSASIEDLEQQHE